MRKQGGIKFKSRFKAERTLNRCQHFNVYGFNVNLLVSTTFVSGCSYEEPRSKYGAKNNSEGYVEFNR